MKTKASTESIAAKRPAWPLPVFSGGTPMQILQSNTGLLSRVWRWIRSRQATRSNNKRLHVAATVSLGEKRFAAVLQVDGLQYLIGGGGTNVTLLAQLSPTESFGKALKEAAATPKKRSAKRAKKPAAKPAAVRAESIKPEFIRSGAIEPEANRPAAIRSATMGPAAITSEPVEAGLIEGEASRPAAIKPAAVKPAAIKSGSFKPAPFKPASMKHSGLQARKQA
jgi:hypothetical protein